MAKTKKKTKPVKPNSSIFNGWWTRNFNHSTEDLYRLFTVDRVRRAGRQVCQIPRSFTKSSDKRTKFREFLLKYINLFKADTGITDTIELPAELPKCKISPFILKTSPSCNSLGIYANKRIAKGKVIDCFPVYKIQVSGDKYELLAEKKTSDNLAESERQSGWGKQANPQAKIFYCVEGPIKFLNHACTPHNNLLHNNLYTQFTALKTIQKNSELFIDYGNNFFTEDDPCTNPICCKKK